ncbi:MAG: hypothetical protein AAF721_12270 [Myxococcota bacterium]
MRPQILLGALFAVLALGAGAYAILADQAPDSDAAEASADRRERRSKAGTRQSDRSRQGDAPSDRSEPGLEARVAKLEREVSTLRRQLALSVGRPLPSSSGDEADGLVAELDSPELDSTVRDIVADERQRERSTRWERRSQRALESLTEAAGLDDEQQTAIAALWDTERERMLPLIMEARSGERDFDEVRKEVEALREETDTEAKKVLSEAQLEAYEENRPRGPGGRGRGGGGRGGQRGSGRPSAQGG